MMTPNDTSRLQTLADEGTIKPETLVALAGKTEGTGFHDDWGRVLADIALREWTAKFLDIPVDEVAKRVIFVLSGGCPGVITPHITAVTRDRKSTRLNSSHANISYAVFCLKKKKTKNN